MRGEVRTARLTVVVGEADQWHHRPLYAEVVRLARHRLVAGATVLRGIEGFGRAGTIHTTRLVSLSENLPVSVVLVDREDRLRALAAELRPMLRGGLMVLDHVEDLLGGDPATQAPDPR